MKTPLFFLTILASFTSLDAQHHQPEEPNTPTENPLQPRQPIARPLSEIIQTPSSVMAEDARQLLEKSQPATTIEATATKLDSQSTDNIRYQAVPADPAQSEKIAAAGQEHLLISFIKKRPLLTAFLAILLLRALYGLAKLTMGKA
ncbi:MAG: hypothetical protein Q7Q71_08425 [Verrucomicrobiota bacterium JB023]|nr:hypothetical protein [Verrucomicrobiota bacterium JB023]